MDAVIEKSKEFILENHIPTLFELLSQVDLNNIQKPDGDLNANNNGCLAADTPKKNSSTKEEKGSNLKNNKEENKKINVIVNIFKNVFEINL